MHPTDASVALTPVWDGALPPDTTPLIAARRGVDLNPLNPCNPEDAFRLRAYLWADQPERIASTEAAIAGVDALSIAAMRLIGWRIAWAMRQARAN